MAGSCGGHLPGARLGRGAVSCMGWRSFVLPLFSVRCLWKAGDASSGAARPGRGWRPGRSSRLLGEAGGPGVTRGGRSCSARSPMPTVVSQGWAGRGRSRRLEVRHGAAGPKALGTLTDLQRVGRELGQKEPDEVTAMHGAVVTGPCATTLLPPAPGQ